MTERIPNIGARGARQRMAVGIVWIVIAIAVLGVMMHFGVARGWRLLLALPFIGAGVGVFQATDKTCVALAAVNKREPDAGDVRLSPAECPIVRAQAKRVWLKAIATAIVATAIAMVV